MPLELRGVTPLLQVFDMPRSLAFYRDTLGFAIVSEVPPDDRADWAWLRLGDADLMLNTRYEAHDRPQEPAPTAYAIHDDTGLFFGCSDVDGAYAWLRERGVDAKPPRVTGYGMKQLYVRDPDGYVLCFQWSASE